MTSLTYDWLQVLHVSYRNTAVKSFDQSGCYSIDFADPRNRRNKKKVIALTCIVPEIAKVTCTVAWPWSSRSRVVCTRSLIVPLNCTTRETVETKKVIALTCIVPEIAKVTCKVAWPWSSRSRIVCTRSLIVPLNCTTRETVETKKKVIALTCIVPEIAKVTCKVAWAWSSRSRDVCTRSLIVPLNC